MAYSEEPPRPRDATSYPDQPTEGAGPAGHPAPITETRGARAARRAHRMGLFVLSFVTLAVLVFLVALIASNTRYVSVSWVFGTSRVSLVWLVVFAAILGWVLGLLVSALFRWRTRRRDPAQASGTSDGGTTSGR